MMGLMRAPNSQTRNHGAMKRLYMLGRLLLKLGKVDEKSLKALPWRCSAKVTLKIQCSLY
jgi:hypothetical protein